ncbi:MAG: tRNA (N(6)-L-threonylcarbamoyladenosine(37)-C(2))-methylthiotransferase MtaB [Mogibacterium sp.]|nr:tRNA (N(6)-L-threonylcarbamoyladenosine(37)-C(2))-methylthiotransferase MtaB [Mogibacterium sp.]
MRVAFHTLGCKVNHYETEAIREAFVSRGAVSVGEEDPADVYIINTCTVTNIADRKSRQYIRRVKRVNPDALIVVTGCYAQVEPDEVASLPEVDMVIGNGLKSRICDMVFAKLAGTGSTGAETDKLVMPRNELTEYENMGMVASSEPGMTRAYIKIQEGCDRFCSYCLIPFARGPVRSRMPEEIVSETQMLLDSGVREIVLTGINTALYGTEEGFDINLTDEERREGLTPMEAILARLDAIAMPEGDDFRIRLSSLEPTVVDKDHVEKIIRHRRLCHHLHLSVQNGSDKILRSMNRHYTRDEYLDIVKAIREFDPLYGITTDIIVGFPGEDEADFEDTLDIVRKSEFGKVHVFRYSPRKGTVGEKLPDVVSGELKNERSDRLETEAIRTSEEFRRKNFGRMHKVLTEEIQDGYMTGYTDNYIKVYIPDPEGRLEPGMFVDVQLTDIYKEGCIAKLN